MTAFADLHEFVNRMTGGNSGLPETVFVHKESRARGGPAAAPIAGRYTSMWEYEGIPSHGSPPTSVVAPDNTTAGAMRFAAASGGRQKWMPSAWAQMSAAGGIVLYDRLLHIGNLDGTVTTAQTVGGAITRNTNGAGNQIWAEIYTQIGATGTTITASYTNESGASKTSVAVSIGATGLREAQRMIPLSLAAGDYGVRAVASVTLAATTGTAGNFGIVVMRPIAAFGLSIPGIGAMRTYIDGTMPDVSTGCLAGVYLPSTTTAPVMDLFLSLVER